MDNFAETLWHEFVVETEEHLQAVEPMLAGAHPHQTTPADIAQLFRSFHSVKGLARAMDMLGMEGVAHHAENLLGLVRDGRAALTPAVADLLLQSVDALKRMRDVVAETRQDVAPDPELVARLAAAFAEAGGDAGSEWLQAPSAAVIDGASLHEDPEMLAIFVEMVKARGPELCGALGATRDERETAADAAETLIHAAEVMNFDALSAGFAGLRDALQAASSVDGSDEPVRQDLLSRLGDIRLQIELVGEISGQDSGVDAFSAALAERIGDEWHRLAVSIAAINRRLRDDMADGDRLAAEADGAAIARLARTLHGMTAALSLTRIAGIALLIEDIYSRVASGDVDASETLVDVGDEIFSQIGGIEDFTDREAARFADRLRAPLISSAWQASPALSEGSAGISESEGLVAGLSLPPELLAILSTDNLAELERGIARDGLVPYEILLHLEAEPETAGRLIAWLTGEARPITNRTVVTAGESWFEFLALSALDPAALTAALLALDPDRRCVKRVRRLTATPGGEPVLGQAPAIAAAADATALARPSAAANLIRVRGETLDAFLDELGEMRALVGTLTHLIRGAGSREIAARARIFAANLPRDLRNEFLAVLEDFREHDRRLLQSEEQISGRLSRLHQSALELRVVPVDVVFNRLPRMVRDLAQQHGKSVELLLEGRDVRIDKSMVEALADPLIHMVRNALDHGIEPPEERRASRKPEHARLTLRAAQHASEIHIDVIDDGRGLDAEAIRAKAISRGLVSPAQAAAMADSEVFKFIFEAGLSTARAVTETSGRGVGMDVVLATVRRLNGDITLRSEPGRGTAFTLVLPVSAALQTALIVRVGDQNLAIPERHVLAVAEIATDAVRLIGGHRSILHREAMLPLYDLAHLLGMRRAVPPAGRTSEPVIVTTNGRQMIGLEVDAIERRQELFLKDLDPRLACFPGVGGASVLGDGRVVLVLDGEELIQLAAHGVERLPATAIRMAS